MLKGLYTAYTGMINEQHRMDVMTNNLANADTNGYKKEGATSQAFDTVLAYKIKDLSEPGNLPKNLGTAKTFDEDSVDNPDRWINRTGMNLGVKIGENYVDYSEGPIKETGNTFDLAISDRGFFAVEYTNKAGETSTKYTRDGNFTMDRQGYLVTQDGDFVLDENGRRIRMNTALPVSIDRSGRITQDGTEVAVIGLTDFEDYDYLERFGENFFQPVDGATEIDCESEIYSGYLETANISVVTEMVNMITIQRQYESNQKVITTFDETLDTAVNQLGKVN
ncbi:MAG: flagellar hook-basal body protein [Lachnospiraceae bacterium]|nr:flagellar hook-basal body protein [Lachnospiraceae bacterium]